VINSLDKRRFINDRLNIALYSMAPTEIKFGFSFNIDYFARG